MCLVAHKWRIRSTLSCSRIVITRATVVSQLLYASPAWWGYLKADERNRLQSIIAIAVRYGYLPRSFSTLDELREDSDEKLFFSARYNPFHVLHRLLPQSKNVSYNLRQRRVLVKCGIAECGMRKVKCGIENCGNKCGMVGKMWNAENVNRVSLLDAGCESVSWATKYTLLGNLACLIRR